MSLSRVPFDCGLLIDRHPSNRLLKCYLIILLTFGLITSSAIGQTRRTPPQRRRAVTQPAPPASPAINLDDTTPIDPVIVAESQRAQQRELEDQKKLEAALAARNEPSATSVDDLWREYRQTFPFHTQVIALSDPATDGSRTLIIFEPPPQVPLGAILTGIGSDLLLNHRIKKQSIGYDGWVKDVAVAIKGNDEALQAMLSRLNQLLFSTSYKSYTLKLPVRSSTRPLDLNLTVTPAELNQWVIKDAEQFFPVEGGSAETFGSLARKESAGVYVSHKRGLIGWWIPKKRNLYECRVSARQFAIDADLVIGALANQSGVLVLGRERQVPVDILPPLRFETLALLADVQEGQQGSLAQSYERNHPLAGRISGEKDWAPILLSPELRDTEYGSLLNITDQLLKGWSNSGETKYENFPYPIPSNYPFARPVWVELGVGSSNGSLTYNWNTKGAGFTVDFGSATCLALNRTGALPVTYLPEGAGSPPLSVSAAEDKAYNYFSSLGDPNLTRVVQYAALYQIFSAFDVAHSNKPIPADSYPAELLESMTTELKDSLKTASDAELQSIAEQLMPSLRLSLEETISSQMKTHLENIRKEIDQLLLSKGYRPGTKEYAENFDFLLSDWKKKQEESVKQNLTNLIREQLALLKQGDPPKDEREESLRQQTLTRYAHFKQVPQRYAVAIDRRAHGWIHTPVVVISWNNDAEFIGGHNLDARVSKMKVDETLEPGQVNIDETGALVINSADVPRVRAFARSVERNGLFRELAIAFQANDPIKIRAAQNEIRRALTSAEVVAMRPREGALQLSGAAPPSKPPINKPPMSNGEPGGVDGAGWGGDGRSSLPVMADLRRSRDSGVRIKSSAGRFDVEHGGEAGTNAYRLVGLTHEDAVDVAALLAAKTAKRGDAVIVEFEGLPEQKALGTLRSIEIQMADKGSPVELIARLFEGEAVASREAPATKYNFSQPRIEVGEITTLETGELQGNIALTAPAMNNLGQSIRFTSELKFNRSTPREVVTAVTNKVATRLADLAKAWSRATSTLSHNLTIAKYNADLARSLKRIRTRTKLKFDVKSRINFPVGAPQGLKDIYIGNNLFRHFQPEAAVGS